MKIKGVIFDLDGVITDTAPLHFNSWAQAVKTVGIDNLDKSFLDKLRGVGRADSLDLILKTYDIKISQEKFNELLEYKNNLYKQGLKKVDRSWILPGVLEFIEQLKSNDIKICLGSASHNAKNILTKLELLSYFDQLVDPSKIINTKPAPDIFLKGAELLNLDVDQCVVVEDANAGYLASKAAQIKCIGIGINADISIKSTEELSIDLLS
ncbi:beta-phosphoglucomutase [Mycoplasma sp. HU2014]|uniref:beta-phosphoglucomutase n=1 Tax=Mycoplasma sp. HU2014 TaxID=1664275 RepID=UPI00067CC42F|nr:beta-phosphoglucomutase [Mycoplasma sp. HU2014]KNG79468.1 beta-phosphoglucomutase [Mycoplasma sp. HU2014]